MDYQFNIVKLPLSPAWEITYNTLHELDPCNHELSKDDFKKYSLGLFTQDLLQIANTEKGLLIDVGWYPDSDPAGCYGMELVRQDSQGDWFWEEPVVEFETRSLADLIAKINEITTG